MESPERVTLEVQRRLAAVFGEVLPAVTRDDADPMSPQHDLDLLLNRPPHCDR